MFALQAEGRRVTTIEGLHTTGPLHPVQQAFHEHHALQCEFCTAGMVMATVSLLEEIPTATKREVRLGLEGILLPVHRLPEHRQGRAGSGRSRLMTVVGSRVLRREDPVLLTGEARFVEDLPITGVLHLKVVRSPFADARIPLDRHRRGSRLLPGVVAVLTGADLRDAWQTPLPCAWPVTDDMKNPARYWPLPVDEVHFAGEGVDGGCRRVGRCGAARWRQWSSTTRSCRQSSIWKTSHATRRSAYP